jgi:Arc/MetJ family transcription regulator
MAGMYLTYILVHMRTTMIINDALLARAMKLTGLTEKTAVVHAGLEALVARAAAARLARLGGSDARAEPGARRRSEAVSKTPTRKAR